ncbi:MAG: hypothetical protein PHE19_02230 [Candidatus Cloacimonetes bacterium]|nr:hypothetical protein [Candidatus Cloacimonadota bacterium]
MDLMTQREIRDRIKLRESLFNSKDKIITIAGLSKNAGKTSFLNYLIEQYPYPENLAITTGHDGEEQDFLTGLKKPKIQLQAGNYFTTIADVFIKHPSDIRIIKKLDIYVLGKPLYLAQALTAIETEIFGGAHKEEQIMLSKEIQSLGANYVIIDGSLDRKSIALSPEVSAILIVASPLAGDLQTIKQQLNRLYQISKIRKTELADIDDRFFYYEQNGEIVNTHLQSFFKNENELVSILKNQPDYFYIPSAVTDHVMKKFKDLIANYEGRLIIKHPLHLMCSDHNLQIFLKANLFCLNNFPLSAFCLNSYSVENNHLPNNVLMESIQEVFVDIPVIDVQSVISIC